MSLVYVLQVSVRLSHFATRVPFLSITISRQEFYKRETERERERNVCFFPSHFDQAIWMMPTHNQYGQWPASGEIDIMESRGNPSTYTPGGVNKIGSTLHWGEHDWDQSFDVSGFLWSSWATRHARRVAMPSWFAECVVHLHSLLHPEPLKTSSLWFPDQNILREGRRFHCYHLWLSFWLLVGAAVTGSNPAVWLFSLSKKKKRKWTWRDKQLDLNLQGEFQDRTNATVGGMIQINQPNPSPHAGHAGK